MTAFRTNKGKKPWGRIFYILILVFSLIIFWNFVSREDYPIVLTGNTKVYLGLSVVEQDFSSILRDINDNSNNNVNSDWLTSFLLQSPDPAALIYLDYIYIDKDATLPDNICFKSITMTKSGKIPIQIAPEVIPAGLSITPEKYEYKFPLNRCMRLGEKYIMPHTLLGVLPVNSTAKFLWVDINGYSAADYFPFDKQSIKFDLSVEIDDLVFSPSIEAVVAQKGWEGKFWIDKGIPVLHLNRFGFYRWALVLFFIIMVVTIPSLNNVVDDISGFFEISFGLLLGLWGTHEIFIPNYVATSVPIDIVVYLLYILVMAEILITLLPEINRLLLKIRIENRNTRNEITVIENRSFFSVDLPESFLRDHHSKTVYMLPPIRIPGRRKSLHKIIIWTRKPASSDPESNQYITYLYMEKDRPVWTDVDGAVFLKTSSKKTLSTFLY